MSVATKSAVGSVNYTCTINSRARNNSARTRTELSRASRPRTGVLGPRKPPPPRPWLHPHGHFRNKYHSPSTFGSTTVFGTVEGQASFVPIE